MTECHPTRPAISLRARQQHSPDQAISLPACSYYCNSSWWWGGGACYTVWWRMAQSTDQMLLSSGPWSPPFLACNMGKEGVGDWWVEGCCSHGEQGLKIHQKEPIAVPTPPSPSRGEQCWQLLADFSGQFGGKNSAAEEKFSPLVILLFWRHLCLRTKKILVFVCRKSKIFLGLKGTVAPD